MVMGRLYTTGRPTTLRSVLITSESNPAACMLGNLEAEMILKAVWEREQIIGTALGGGIAVPHARLIEINSPVVMVGISQSGIDFNAMDGAPVKLIFLLLTPQRDQGAQLQILADIARIFTITDIRAKAINALDYESFMEAIQLAPEKN